MVTIKVENLINFVAEVFSHSESSPEEAQRIADLSDDRAISPATTATA